MAFRLTRPRTVAAITSRFTQMVDDLDAVERESLDTARIHEDEIARHTVEREKHRTEASAAATVREKIRALVSAEPASA